MYLPVSLYRKNTVFKICCMCHVVVVNHMVRHMYDMMRLECMRTCFSIRVEYVTHMKFRGISGILSDFSYTGQCGLIIDTPLGGSMCRIYSKTSKISIFILIRSHCPTLCNRGLIKSC